MFYVSCEEVKARAAACVSFITINPPPEPSSSAAARLQLAILLIGLIPGVGVMCVCGGVRPRMFGGPAKRLRGAKVELPCHSTDLV